MCHMCDVNGAGTVAVLSQELVRSKILVYIFFLSFVRPWRNKRSSCLGMLSWGPLGRANSRQTSETECFSKADVSSGNDDVYGTLWGRLLHSIIGQ